MAHITLDGVPAQTSGSIPQPGSKAPDFNLTATDLSNKTLDDYKGQKLILNIFPSVNTGICSAAVRKFNEEAANLPDTTVLCISRDLPFSQANFCAAEGIDKVVMLSDFKTAQFGKDYGLLITSGAFDGLLSRVVLIINESGIITYGEQVPEIGQEPDYQAALKNV